MPLKTLFSALTLGHFLKHKWLYTLTFLSIVLGTLSFSSIRFLNTSILKQFRQSVQTLTDKQLLPVWSDTNVVPVSLYNQIRSIEGVQAIVPIREVTVVNPQSNLPLKLQYLDLIELSYIDPQPQNTDQPGTNFLQDSSYAFVSPGVLKRWPEKTLDVVGSGRSLTLSLNETPFLKKTAGLTLTQDIRWSSKLWTDPQTVSRFELYLDPQKSQSTLEALKQIIQPPLRLGALQERYRQGETMIQSFQINLLSLSLVSFLVGFFIIFLSLSLSFKQRYKDISLLKSLGAASPHVNLYLLSESLVLALIGGSLGIALGYGLASFLIDETSRNVSQIYFPLVASLEPSWVDLGLGLGLAILATLAAGFYPWIQISKLSLKTFLSQDSEEIAFDKQQNTLVKWAFFFAGLTMVSHKFTSFDHPWFSFLTCLFFVLSCLGFLPKLLDLLLRVFGSWTKGLIQLSLREARSFLFRHAQVSAALVIAFALSFAIVDMVGSFQVTVGSWISDQFDADIYLSNQDTAYNPFGSSLQPEVQKVIRNLSGVSASYGVYRERVPFRGRFPTLSVTDWDGYLKAKPVRLRPRQAPQHSPVLVSENFSLRYDLNPGDTFRLDQTSAGSVEFEILGLFSDYSSESGHILLDEKTAPPQLQDKPPRLMHIYLKDPNQTDQKIDQLLNDLDHLNLRIFSHKSIQKYVSQALDQTFILANALRWVSFAVAFIGLVIHINLLSELKLKTRALLRSYGASSQQLFLLFVTEGLFIALFSWLIAVFCGLGLTWILIYGIQKHYFSWILQISIQGDKWIYAVLFLILAIFTLGFFLLKKQRQSSIAQSLTYE